MEVKDSSLSYYDVILGNDENGSRCRIFGPLENGKPVDGFAAYSYGDSLFVGEIKNGVLVFGFEYTLAKKFVYFGPFNHFNFSDGPCFRYVPDSNSVVFGATQQGQLASGPYLLFLHEKRTINLQEGKFKNDGTFGYDLIRPLHNPYPFLDEDFFSWKAEVASGDPLTAALSEEGELKVKMIHVNSVATGFPEGLGFLRQTTSDGGKILTFANYSAGGRDGFYCSKIISPSGHISYILGSSVNHRNKPLVMALPLEGTMSLLLGGGRHYEMAKDGALSYTNEQGVSQPIGREEETGLPEFLPKETTLNNGEKSVALSVYAREKKEGFSMVYQKDEDFFGEFHEDVPAGFGVKIYKDQRALAGLFQGETITGPAFYFANKSLSIGKMKEGVFDGSVTRFVDGGSVYEEVYQNGQKVAEKKLPLSFSSFYPNFYVEENFSGTWIRSQGQALYGKRYIARCCLDGYNEYNGARLLVRTGNELLIDHYVAHQPGPQQFSRIGNVDGVHVRYGLSFLDGGKDFAKVLQYDTLKKELAFGFKNGTADSTKFIYNEESGLLSYPRPAMSNSNPLAEGVDSYKDALESLVGLEGVKKALLGVRAFVNKNKKVTGVALAFLGNPGTGKNTVAKIFSGILVESGAFPSKVFVELNRANLAEGGSSASFENVVDNAFLKAKSGVLYFENFPSFFENPLRTGYDTAKVAIFVNLMHKYDGTCCPIVSGPILAMNDLLNSDPTLRACFSDLVIFPDYNVEELRRLLDNELKKDNYEMNEDAKTSLVEFVYSFHFQNGYSNIALLSKALRGVIKHQNIRTVDSESDDRLLTLADVDELKKEDISLMGVQQEAQEDCEKELENLVGLKEVKEQLRQLKDYLALNQGHSNLSLNMTFTGNPGTGKTTVARLFGGILKKEGFLSNGHLVECDRSGLVAQYIGQTQKLTHEKFQSALGGVLFIDEAYQLAHKDDSRDFGSEAVAALLKDMEDYKGKICVILAGYKAPMQEMLATNQGFQSRIQFEIAFPDYTKEELGQILDKDLAKEGFTMDEEGRAFFLEEIEKKRALPTFANARTVRDALHGVELAASERLVANSSHTRLITKEDVEKHFLKGNPDLAKVSLPETTLPQEVIDSSQEEFLQSGTPVDEALLTDATLTLIGKDGFQRMGTLVSPKGLFLTTLEGLPEGELSTILRVLTYDKRALFFTLGAKLLSVNKKNNLALFTLLQAPQNLAYLPLASSMNLLDGAPLEALSCPQGLGNLALLEVTKATLSSKEGQAPKLIYEGKSGNEGSPLLDKNQKGIVGILNSDASTYIPSEAILDFFR